MEIVQVCQKSITCYIQNIDCTKCHHSPQMLKFQLQFVMIARALLVCSNLLLSKHDCILTAEKLIIICLLILQVTLMTISTLIIKINNYVYLHCWPISVVPTCPPSSSWLGIVIGTLVTLIMEITVIVLVMTDLKCCRHSMQANTGIYTIFYCRGCILRTLVGSKQFTIP